MLTGLKTFLVIGGNAGTILAFTSGYGPVALAATALLAGSEIGRQVDRKRRVETSAMELQEAPELSDTGRFFGRSNRLSRFGQGSL